jgi:hypothetical protein
MIKAQHHWFIYPFFKWFSRTRFKSVFNGIAIFSDITDNEQSILFLSNHFSWWDGFLAEYVNQQIFQKKYYVMMLEEELSKHLFLRNTGAFSIKKNSRSSLDSLKYSASILSEKNNFICLFPQGKIQSIYRNDFRFEKGVEFIQRYSTQQFRIVMAAWFQDFLSEKKAHLYVYLQEFKMDEFSISELENQYNSFYSQCLQKQMKLEQ